MHDIEQRQSLESSRFRTTSSPREIETARMEDGNNPLFDPNAALTEESEARYGCFTENNRTELDESGMQDASSVVVHEEGDSSETCASKMKEIRSLIDGYKITDTVKADPELRNRIGEEILNLDESSGDVEVDHQLEAGKKYYFVSADWLVDLNKFLWANSNDSRKASWPGPVNNHVLFSKDGEFLDHSPKSEDFKIVTAHKWKLLMKYFGGGPEIVRTAVNENGEILVDEKGCNLKIIRSTKPDEYIRLHCSQNATISQLRRTCCEIFKIKDPNTVRVWDYYNLRCYALMHNLSSQVQSHSLMQDQYLMIEEQNEKGEFEWDVESAGYSRYGSSPATDIQVKDTVTRRAASTRSCAGLVGLANLGNTCYMNSILQCLGNTVELRDYFLNDEFVPDRNEDNPLGNKGKLADAFASLLKTVWQTKDAAEVSPRGFKNSIAQFKPDFAGFDQHDSQEFLSFLLDGLHEDLNRVRDKPYVESVQARGRPDEVVAKESMAAYQMRNHSRIADLFTGLFKSTLVCPDDSCGHTSVTFDPFMCAQLPLEVAAPERTISISAFVQDPANLKRRTKVTFAMDPDSSVIELRNEFAKRLDVPLAHVILVEVWNNRVTEIVSDLDSVYRFNPKDTYVVFVDPFAEELIEIEGCLLVRWERPLHPASPEPAPIMAGGTPCPFAVADVWVGEYLCLQRPRQMRLTVVEVERVQVESQEPALAADGLPREEIYLVNFEFDFRGENPQGYSVITGSFVCQGLLRWAVDEAGPEAAGAAGLKPTNPNKMFASPPARSLVAEAPASPVARSAFFEFEPNPKLRTPGLKESVQGISGEGKFDETGTHYFGTILHRVCGPFQVRKVTSQEVLDSFYGLGNATNPGDQLGDEYRRNGESAPKPRVPERPAYKAEKEPNLYDSESESTSDSSSEGSDFSNGFLILEREPPTRCMLMFAHQRRSIGKEDSHSSSPGRFFNHPFMFSVETNIKECDMYYEVLRKLYQKSGVTTAKLSRRLLEQDILQIGNYFRLLVATSSFTTDPYSHMSPEERAMVGREVKRDSDELLFPLGGNGAAYFVLLWNWVALIQARDNMAALAAALSNPESTDRPVRDGKSEAATRTQAKKEIPNGESKVSPRAPKQSDPQGISKTKSKPKAGKGKKVSGLVIGKGVKKSSLARALFGRPIGEDSKDEETGGLTLYDCLELFSKEEQLSQMDTWYCPKCQDHKEAFKQIQFWSLPNVLVCQLKRFSQGANHHFADKLETEVKFPITGLDLREYCLDSESKEGAIYDLFAVSNHYGGLGGGHYTAFALNQYDREWYEFDDSSVRHIAPQIASKVIQNPAAYVLFYRRRELGVQMETNMQQQAESPAQIPSRDTGRSPIPVSGAVSTHNVNPKSSGNGKKKLSAR